jgi:hypothetical protein
VGQFAPLSLVEQKSQKSDYTARFYLKMRLNTRLIDISRCYGSESRKNEEIEKMKRFIATCFGVGLALVIGAASASAQCVTIQDGGLEDSAGNPISTGYDDFGYNYQAVMYNGRYCDYDRVVGGDYCDVDLIMKWNDGWLSKSSCDGDALLDRHLGYASYIGSGAWLTNHQAGKVEVNGKMRKWTYFVKIVAAPADAVVVDGFWQTADGIEIGEVIWGSFAIIQQVSNDPSYGEHGILYKSPLGPGFGHIQ